MLRNHHGRPITLTVMLPGTPPHRCAGLGRIVALALACGLAVACALAPASAPAAVSAAKGTLSPRLAELERPSVRDAPPVEQARKLSLAAEGPGSLVREGNRILVEVRFDRGAAAAVDELRAAGAGVVNVSRRYQTVTVAAKPSELQALSGVPGVTEAKEVLKPIAYASGCPSGAVVSEGVGQLHAGDEPGEARQAFGVDGSGVTVGILSDSYNRATEAADGSGPVATTASQDVSSGDLPGVGNTCPGQRAPVSVLDDSSTEGEDEGRAMSQIVHDVAPGAKLAFATAFTGETAFAENIERLANPPGKGGAGAQVIADDVAYFDEPFFQDGPVSVAVNNVVGGGASYFSAAGNDNLIEAGTGNEIASWEAPQFRDAGSCPAGLTVFEALQGILLNASHCMDFDPGGGVDNTFGITVEKRATLTVDLQWAEPWHGVNADLDAFLLDGEGNLVKSGGVPVWSIEDNASPVGTQQPFEFFQWENNGSSPVQVQLAINRYSGAAPRLKFVLMENGGGVTATEYPHSGGGDAVGPTIFGHAGAASAIGVGAVRFNTTSEPERYSSRGPVTHYFGPVSGTLPAAALPSPETLSKPDLVATDCGVTTFFASLWGEDWRFCGTSAAAPHAAAVAALMRQANPSLTPAQLRQALAASARPVGAFGPHAVGAGLVDAAAALAEVAGASAQAGPTGGEEGTGGGGQSAAAPASESPRRAERPSTAAAPAAGRRALLTFLRWHPRRVIRTPHRTARAVFWFGSNAVPVTFLCRVDGRRFRRCGRRYALRFRPGRHVLRVKARDAAGHVDRSPVVYRFRVKRLRAG